MWVSEEKIGKTFRGTGGWAKGLIFKITARDEKSAVCTIHTHLRDLTVNAQQMGEIEAEEVTG